MYSHLLLNMRAQIIVASGTNRTGNLFLPSIIYNVSLSSIFLSLFLSPLLLFHSLPFSPVLSLFFLYHFSLVIYINVYVLILFWKSQLYGFFCLREFDRALRYQCEKALPKNYWSTTFVMTKVPGIDWHHVISINVAFFPLLPFMVHTYTHSHTHTYIYIYIYTFFSLSIYTTNSLALILDIKSVNIMVASGPYTTASDLK